MKIAISSFPSPLSALREGTRALVIRRNRWILIAAGDSGTRFQTQPPTQVLKTENHRSISTHSGACTDKEKAVMTRRRSAMSMKQIIHEESVESHSKTRCEEIEGETTTWHYPDPHVYESFSAIVRKKILEDTDRATWEKKKISQLPIILSIYPPNVRRGFEM